MKGKSSLDVGKLTQEQAGLEFQDLAKQLVRESGYDLTQAWADVRAMNRELFAKAFPGDVRRASGSSEALAVPANPYTGGSGSRAAGSLADKLMPRGIALPNAGSIEALGLPADATFDEFATADRANAGAIPRDSGAIFEGLVRLQSKSGKSPESAREAARLRYPLLFAEASTGPKAGTNGDGEEASRRAHLASAVAGDTRPGHLGAAAAHQKAAELQDKAGHTEVAEMHQRMATFHAEQASRSTA